MDFMNNEWYPSYLKLFFEDPEVIAHWDSIVSCNDMAQRIELMKEMTDVIYMDFKAQSDSMLLPLSQIEKELIKELKTEYALARTMNNAITQNVKSVNELQEKRTELLKQLDTDDVLKNAFDKATEEASKISDQMQKLVDQYNKNEKKIDNLIDKTIKK